MRFLDHIRSRTRHKSPPSPPGAQVYNVYVSSHDQVPSQLAWALPRAVLERIFLYLCPHTQDDSYTTCEESMIADGCMLCQMRDLAHCSSVCRTWKHVAQELLYHSVRIDSVHFCDRADNVRSKKKHKGDELQDVAALRLKLFSQTVRENRFLGSLVEYLKMPYMVKETCKADLARTIAVLPNLRYVDLPEGVSSDEGASMVLKQELEGRCHELRKVRYTRGSEQTFTMLSHKRIWQNLEIVEIDGLEVDAEILSQVLGSFPVLREVKLGGEMMVLSDEILDPTSTLQLFPPLEQLVFEKAPAITARGLASYLSRPETRERLRVLKLSETGVSIPELHVVLTSATSLVDFSISETVSRSFPVFPVPPLSGPQLETLFFGILPHHATAHPPVSESYYNYLANSLLTGSFPKLSSLYAYSERLPDALLPLPDLPFANRMTGLRLNTDPTTNKSTNMNSGHSSSGPFSASTPTSQPLFTSPWGPSPGKDIPQAALASRISTYSVDSSQSSHSSRRTNGSARGGPAAINGIVPQTAQMPSLPGLVHPLDLFTKSPAAPEMEWSLTTILPPSKRNGRRGSASATRPLSLVMLEQTGGGGVANIAGLAPWRERSCSPVRGSLSSNSGVNGSLFAGVAANEPLRRQSETATGRILVGNGFGGFLSVPGAEAQREAGIGHSRPGSKSKGGDWMG